MSKFGALAHWRDSSCKSFFHILIDPSPLGESIFLAVWRIKIPRKLRFYTWLVLHGQPNPLDKLHRKVLILFGSSCCILYWKAEEDIGHILWSCH